MSADRPARLSVGVVSAGRVGAVVGAALATAGHHVVAASGVSRASVARAAALLPGVPIVPPDEAAAGADLVLLAVPDDVLPGLVRGLAATRSFRPGQIVVHTAGSYGVAVLDPAVARGVLPLALHPVMTFTGRTEDVARLAGSSVAVTAEAGEEAAWSVGEALVVEMGAEPVRVPEAVRPLYHAALAHGANHLITLVRDCVDVLEQAGVRPAERIVAPLLSAALDNVLRHGDRALTGPVARGDVGTVRSHLRELTAVDPDLAATYRVLAGRTATRARKAGLLPDHAADEVRAVLDEEGTADGAHERGSAVTTARTRGGYVPGEPTVHAAPSALAPVTRALRGAGRRIALVPTMGALHEGHRELIRHARRMPGAGVVVVSIFVNPLQFGPTEDLARYPRPREADLQLCQEEGVELVFAPGVDDMFPGGAGATSVDPGPLGAELEGAVRPGHFRGVLTVVAKLFHVVGPDVAFFGEKDYQQLVLVRGMVTDLNFPLAVVGVPTVREPDGLALSSRNTYLAPEDRPSAATLHRALAAGAGVSARGPEAVLEAARAVLDAEPALAVDYLALRDPDLRLDPQVGPARLLVAARLGSTRLIDNIAVRL